MRLRTEEEQVVWYHLGKRIQHNGDVKVPTKETLALSIAGLALFCAAALVLTRAMAPGLGAKMFPQNHEAQAGDVIPGPLDGIDVSHFQGEIDWQQVKASGIHFAYAKATEGLTYIDPNYHQNAAGAAAEGVTFGAYHFYRPDKDPIDQAEHFLNVIATTKGSLPPAIDVEVMPPNGVNIAQDVATFATYVKAQTGCTPVIYASLNFWDRELRSDIGIYPLWLADYADHVKLPKGATSWQFWQVSNMGSVPGIMGSVDLDKFAGSSTDLAALTCK